MLTFDQLNTEQKNQLKCNYYSTFMNSCPSWYELAFIDDFVSEADITQEYKNTIFSPDDFF